MTLQEYFARMRTLVDGALDRLLPAPEGPAATVNEAMRYAVFGGGKRLRPVLAIAGCEVCGGEPETVLGAAAALEMIHTYSLIHDDLPALDDDDLRRGRATTHKEFGEAEAILAGDGLLTLAFHVLATEPDGEAEALRRADAVAVVAKAAGVAGMVGGQMADLEAERRPVEAGGLEWIHRRKTGALLSASIELGAIHGCAEPTIRQALARYGMALGLAFQIADDILDVTSTAEELGKTPGKDEIAGKATYPALYGLEESRNRAAALVDSALAELEVVGTDCRVLAELARFAAERTH